MVGSWCAGKQERPRSTSASNCVTSGRKWLCLADVKWIKITTDIFDDEKVLMIETMPSADSVLVIWFKLLAFAGKQNNDGVFLMSNRIAYTDEMLAAIFRRDVNVVRLALRTFEQFGMIEIIENVITIPNWNKHQSLDAYEKKKERDRLYQAERRANQRALIEQSSDKSSDSQATQSSYVAVSDKEEEKEEDKEKELYSSIVSYLNNKAGTKYKATTKNTRKAIHARLSDGFTLDDFKTVIDKKCVEWTGTEFEKYLRPETLFGNKFEGYLNAKVTNGRNGNNGGASGNHVPDTKKIGHYI
jgi:uncharacterized phage protein (TIGR02220 family)/predicted phage replisome organizer